MRFPLQYGIVPIFANNLCTKQKNTLPFSPLSKNLAPLCGAALIAKFLFCGTISPTYPHISLLQETKDMRKPHTIPVHSLNSGKLITKSHPRIALFLPRSGDVFKSLFLSL